MKLSLDEQEALESLIQSQGFRVLIKYFDFEVDQMGADVLRVSLTSAESEREILQKKLLHQGAQSLVQRFKHRLTSKRKSSK